MAGPSIGATNQNSNYKSIDQITISNTYSSIIFKADICSFVNKVIQHVLMASFSCHVQGSPLMERKSITSF